MSNSLVRVGSGKREVLALYSDIRSFSFVDNRRQNTSRSKELGRKVTKLMVTV